VEVPTAEAASDETSADGDCVGNLHVNVLLLRKLALEEGKMVELRLLLMRMGRMLLKVRLKVVEVVVARTQTDLLKKIVWRGQAAVIK
jgi:hypothetical protein